MSDTLWYVIGWGILALVVALWGSLLFFVGYYPGWWRMEPPEERTYTKEDFKRMFALFEATSEAWDGKTARVYLDLEAGEIRTEWTQKQPKEERE